MIVAISVAALTFGFLRPGNQLFPDQDAAARAALDYYNPVSVKENAEYGGYIFRTAKGEYGYTKPDKGDFGRVNFTSPEKAALPGTVVTASWHTHGATMENVISEIFSPHDMKFNQFHGVNGYLATPSGKFKFFDIATRQTATLGRVRN